MTTYTATNAIQEKLNQATFAFDNAKAVNKTADLQTLQTRISIFGWANEAVYFRGVSGLSAIVNVKIAAVKERLLGDIDSGVASKDLAISFAELSALETLASITTVSTILTEGL